MIKEYQISNFKAFAGPESLPIRPITLIFGPNSSGKSSILQSILMLKQTLDEADGQNTVLLFKGNLVDLGNYREFIHHHDISKDCSFKVKIAKPKDMENLFPCESYLWEMKTLDDSFINLKESCHFETIGISVTFSYNNISKRTTVSRIELFFGDDPAPLITYEPGTPDELHTPYVHRLYNESPEAFCTLNNINIEHKYLSENDKLGIEMFKELVNLQRAYKKINDTTVELKELLQDDLKQFVALEEKYVALEEAYVNVETLNLSKEEKKEMKEKMDEIKLGMDEKKLGMDESNLRIVNLLRSSQDTEREIHIESDIFASYRLCRPGFDFLRLKNFLPDLLNGSETQYIIHEEFFSSDSGNISLFTLAVSYALRGFLKDLEYLGPLRSYPERYFTFSGIETQYVGKTGKYVPDILISNEQLLAELNEQFAHFGMGYELRLDTLSAHLSDIHDLFALRLYEKSTGVHVGITDVGFGVSQVLPIIVQSLLSREKTLLIEQPELHLHPRLQAELGDLFISSALGNSKNTFIIETHSEHLILRLLRRIRETTEGNLEEGQLPIRPDDVAVIYAKPSEDGTRLLHLRVTEDGDFADRWPDGFFSERARELF